MDGLGITSDKQLLDLAEKNGLPINYIGFAEDLDTLPIGFSIINLGDDNLGGTHWTMLYSDQNQVIYSDSYGVGPEDIILQLARGRDVYWNTKQVQGYHEAYCGVWVLCTALALKGQKNKTEALNKYLSQFETV